MGILSLGVSPVLTHVSSSLSSRTFTTVTGRAFYEIAEGVSLEGGLGVQNTRDHPQQAVGDATLRFENGGGISCTASYQASDASLVLYSAELVNVRLFTHGLLARVTYVPVAQVKFNAQAKFLSISDGNNCTELLLSIGKNAYEQIIFAYEYVYTNYRRQAGPGNNGAGLLYYSPQNLQSHAILLDWALVDGGEGGLSLGGKLGYIPKVDALIRELRTRAGWRPTTSLVLDASLAAGSTYRFTSQYNYVSVAISAYWSL